MTALPDPAHVSADGNAMGARAAKAREAVRGDPGRAERIAGSITDGYLKASALIILARAAVLHAADDPETVEPGRGR